jgi:hypothetical protein
MSKHTPGPWTVLVNEESPYGEIYAPKRETMVAAMIGNGQPLAEVMSDANLIAAAPAMLQALKEAEHEIRYTIDESDNKGQKVLAVIQAAIAQAEGEK